MQINDNNNSPHGKFHQYLFLFSSKFPDLNFAPYVLYIYSCYMKPVRDTNSEPELPVAKRPQRRRASRNGCLRRLKSKKTTNSFIFCNTKHVSAGCLACVASVSMRFRSKERVTRGYVRVKNGARKRAGTGRGRKVRKRLQDKPWEFENCALGLSCLSVCTDT